MLLARYKCDQFEIFKNNTHVFNVMFKIFANILIKILNLRFDFDDVEVSSLQLTQKNAVC